MQNEGGKKGDACGGRRTVSAPLAPDFATVGNILINININGKMEENDCIQYDTIID